VSRDPKDNNRPGQDSRPRTSASSSAAHRRKLEAMFGGSDTAQPPTSSAPTERVFSSPRKSTGRAPTEYRMRLERLRSAREPEEIQAAADLFLSHHQLPDEPDILYKLLQHPSEKVVRDALGQLSSLLMQGRFTGTLLLADHLKVLEGRIEEDATRSYIEGIRAQIAASNTE